MKFNEKLVLNSYLLSLFGVASFEELAKDLKASRLEELDENDNTLFYHELKDKLVSTHKIISDDKLQEYDENIVRHTKTMGRGIKWKYFQYLSLLFVEIYLDKYFEDKEQLLLDLNTHLQEFNRDIEPKKEKLAEYNETELNKLALYNATGSGKTLLLHMNLLQFNHYAKGKMKINKTVLITPNEGLTNQHLEEFQASNIEAEIFSKDSKGLFESNAIEIIEITKLGEENGDKTVAVDSFEDNNLVFIDEGHRGSSGDKWKTNRDKLSANGFAFEYSATFAQAINSAAGAKKKELENEYTKAIIFDYSYKYFFNDGYGKDYNILNLSEDSEDIKQTYLTASLLSFYQQMKIYESSKGMMIPYLIEKPLIVFVGSSVNAVRTQSKKQVSDVVDVLLFIDEFIIGRLEALKSSLASGVIDNAELHRLSKRDFKAFTFDKHLYNPLVFKDRGETALQIKPIELNDGEKDFVEDLDSYLKRNSSKYDDTEIYLLRNQSKIGLGFFTEGNFYPDFIMWIKKDEKQYISFIDPKGLLNLNTKDDPKISLSVKIKEIEEKLNDDNVILNSFIVSVTPYGVITMLQDILEQSELEDKNVLFQQDDRNGYVGKMFDRILGV